MDLETYVDIHKDDTPKELLIQLVGTMAFLGNARVNRTDAAWRRNNDDVGYYRREYQHMMKRVDWLYDKLLKIMEDRDCNANT